MGATGRYIKKMPTRNSPAVFGTFGEMTSEEKIKKLEEEVSFLKQEKKKTAATPAPTSTATGATTDTTTTKPNQKLAISSQPAPSVLRTMNK
jgi:hypothetical protein